MIRRSVLLGILLTVAPVPASKDAQVTERDIAVFRAVIRAGLIPEPNVGDARVTLPGLTVESRTDIPAPAVVSQTLRICQQPAGDIGCVPESSLTSIRLNAVARSAEMEELTSANSLSRTVPANLILTVPPDQVFRGAQTWSQAWSLLDRDNSPECVQFTVPVYINGFAVVYAQRLWHGRGYGWLVRLKPDGREWRVITKTAVWASHPAA